MTDFPQKRDAFSGVSLLNFLAQDIDFLSKKCWTSCAICGRMNMYIYALIMEAFGLFENALKCQEILGFQALKVDFSNIDFRAGICVPMSGGGKTEKELQNPGVSRCGMPALFFGCIRFRKAYGRYSSERDDPASGGQSCRLCRRCNGDLFW